MKTVSRLLILVAAATLTAAILPARAQEANQGRPNPAPVAAVDSTQAPETPTAIPSSVFSPEPATSPAAIPPAPATTPAPSGVAEVGSQSAPHAPVVNNLEQLLLNRQLMTAGGARDPFSTSTVMKRAAADASGDPRFLPLSGQIPKLGLRGYVEPQGKPPVALIEVEGQGTYVVRKGDTIGLTVAGKSSVLKIVSIEQSSARIEAGQLGQVIIVR